MNKDTNDGTYAATLLFIGTPWEAPKPDKPGHSAKLKPLVGNATVFTWFKEIGTLTEIILFCKKRNITGCFSTSNVLLHKLLAAAGTPKDKAALNNYQGSYFIHQDIEFIFINPLEQLVTVPYGAFIARRFISKLTSPASWTKTPSFAFEMLTSANHERIFNSYQNAIAIAVDIETLKENLRIRCIGYTALFLDKKIGEFATHSCVMYITDMFSVSVMRKFNWKLKAPKILQNGKYDISYLARYNAYLYNYLWDTVNMFHCWYCELPKDLSFLGAFFVRRAMYWKDLAETSDQYEYARYNALDTWTTTLVFMAWILQSPEWAKRNYKEEFPLVFPCHLSELIGIKRDMQELEIARAEADKDFESQSEKLNRMLGCYPLSFNTNSSVQNANLRKILGSSDIDSSDEKSLKVIGSRHPINYKICTQITAIRKTRKLTSTYLRTDADITKTSKVGAKELNGRILYAINPHGTETGRMASTEHHFWCGFNVQNVTRGKSVKRTLVSDAGFMLAEADLKQAESRDVGYVSGDANLITAVESPRDFHAINASSFFGLAYEVIFDDATQKTLDKAIRDLSKRTNHGATYLMGWGVLIDTMGEDKIWEAKRLLKLPKSYSLKNVAEHLLAAFHKAYPTLSTLYYPAVVHEVMTTHMLVSHTNIQEPKIYGLEPVWKTQTEWELEPLEGWTRYCFGNPKLNKLDKNSYVAHVSQSLNAKALNRAYLRVFYEIALHPIHGPNFKLVAQIHDSILFQFRIGCEYLMDMVQERMQVPIRCMGYDGVLRIFTVPADVKNGKGGKGAHRWSETE